MIEDEKQVLRDEETYDLTDIDHPAVNVTAKWKLCNLFIDNLEPLDFLSNL